MGTIMVYSQNTDLYTYPAYLRDNSTALYRLLNIFALGFQSGDRQHPSLRTGCVHDSHSV